MPARAHPFGGVGVAGLGNPGLRNCNRIIGRNVQPALAAVARADIHIVRIGHHRDLHIVPGVRRHDLVDQGLRRGLEYVDLGPGRVQRDAHRPGVVEHEGDLQRAVGLLRRRAADRHVQRAIAEQRRKGRGEDPVGRGGQRLCGRVVVERRHRTGHRRCALEVGVERRRGQRLEHRRVMRGGACGVQCRRIEGVLQFALGRVVHAEVDDAADADHQGNRGNGEDLCDPAYGAAAKPTEQVRKSATQLHCWKPRIQHQNPIRKPNRSKNNIYNQPEKTNRSS